MKDDIEQGQNVANTANNADEATEQKTEQTAKDKGGRPKGRVTLADLVTYSDIKESVKVMKEIIRDKEATASQKLSAAKFLLTIKLEGVNLQNKVRQQNLTNSRQTANSKPGKPEHVIKVSYSDTKPDQ
jgi:hypothetical protein